MRGVIKKTSILAGAVLIVCGAVAAQHAEPAKSKNKEDVRADVKAEQGEKYPGRLLVPGNTPYGPFLDQYNRPNLFLQSGAFFGTYGGGLEVLMRPQNSHLYSSLFLSSTFNPDRSVPGAQYIVMGGLTFGYEKLIHATSPGPSSGIDVVRVDRNGTQFYTRVGPGIGVAGVGRIDNSGSEFHPFLHTSAAIGALTRINRKTSFYIELGGRLAWLPILNEKHLLGGPQLSIGFQLSRPPDIRPYDI